MADPSSEQIDAGLRKLGFNAFRAGQREAVETLLTEGRLLLVAPTGGGKSLTYQLPATLLAGTSVVVSPLISLMHDQVIALQERGVAATYLASTLGSDEIQVRMARISGGDYKLVYVAPERLAQEGFLRMLGAVKQVPLIAVDEAHCISQWGHDFRPEYMRIGDVLRQHPDAKVLACTATATPVVRDEILDKLGLTPDTPQRVQGFARPNLAFHVRDTRGKREAEEHVDETLRGALGKPDEGRGTSIVYAPTRKRTEEEARRLSAVGWRVAAYHAAIEGEERERTQIAFASGELEIVVATNAFGMGIDRPDVRCVIHLAPPDSIEAYYQEAGRAGRDGEDAVCLMLTSANDMPLRRHLIERDFDGRLPEPEVVAHKWSMFLELMRWAEGGGCRHDAILRYFGDEAEVLSGCGRCDVCLQFGEDSGNDPQEVTTIVRKALCGVARVQGRFGLNVVAKLLYGGGDDRLQWSGLNDTPTFGTLSDYAEEWIIRLLRRCVTAGWVDFTGGDRPLVKVTEEGREVIHERRPARLLLPPTRLATPVGRSRRSSESRANPVDELDIAGRQLFEALRAWRLERARAADVPPYVVASDRTLRDVALLRPDDRNELTMAHGIGPAKLENYGEEILEVVARQPRLEDAQESLRQGAPQ
ncbi:MAG: RecQ family ATP-dependent DNA helicase [Candidatus Latescibacterota bacterium]|nr:RecQ family ATP-dependent DNA helicase [Candidatus Latescibacterota bacterium]